MVLFGAGSSHLEWDDPSVEDTERLSESLPSSQGLAHRSARGFWLPSLRGGWHPSIRGHSIEWGKTDAKPEKWEHNGDFPEKETKAAFWSFSQPLRGVSPVQINRPETLIGSFASALPRSIE